MSGGSYNYLYAKDASELVDHLDDLAEMADDLAMLGYAPDVARETQGVLADYRAFLNRTNVALSRLENVWHAMEWWQSCDYDEEQFKQALAKYRGETDG